MNLLIAGDDYPNQNKDVYPTFSHVMEHVRSHCPERVIEKIVTFNGPGIPEDAICWAEEEHIPWAVYYDSAFHNRKIYDNAYLRRIVDMFKIDGFVFVPLKDIAPEGPQRSNLRWFMLRAQKAFKQQKTFIFKP